MFFITLWKPLGDKMRIYLSQKESTDSSLISISNISTFNDSVLDAEAKLIIADSFLSSFTINEVKQVINLIVKKMRIGSELIIIEQDLDLLSMKYFRDEISLDYFNTLLFQSPSRSIKNILTGEFIREVISSSNLKIEEQNFDENLCTYTIKVRRSS
jgi:hypothetical protein